MKWLAWKLNMVERGEAGGRDQGARSYRRKQVEKKPSQVNLVLGGTEESMLADSQEKADEGVFYVYGQDRADSVWKADRYRARPYRYVIL